MPRRVTYNSAEVCRIANITYRKLDYWTRRGYVRELNPEPGSGYARRYSAEETWRIRLIGQLVDAGITAEQAAWFTFRGEYDDHGVFRAQMHKHVYVEVFP